MFATCQSLRATPLAAAPKRVERRNVRATRVHASTKKDDVESSDSVMLSRRALGVSSVALGAAFAQNLTFATPAEAKKIISGYTDLAGVDATIAFHKTGTVGADEWYKTVFAPFLNGALHSGEAGGPETGAAFKTVFNVVVMRGREAENETVAVIMVSPSESAAKIVKFFDDKNPFWQTGRDAGWLLGPITCYKTTPFLCRGPDPKTGFPPGFKKGNGAQLAVFGSKIAVQKDWVPAFTSADSDKLHDASGIFTSVAGSLETVKASEFKSRFKSVAVVHGFGTYKQAQTFNAKFVAASEPPFDGISQILDNFQGRAFEVISDTTFPEYLPKAGSRE